MKKVNDIEGKQIYMCFLYDRNKVVSTKLLYSKSKTHRDLFQVRLLHMLLHVLNKYLSGMHDVPARTWAREIQRGTRQTPGLSLMGHVHLEI